MSGNEKDRVAIVTGGSKGLGFAIVQALGNEGYRVAILDVDKDAGQEARNILQADSIECMFLPCDVCVLEEVHCSFNQVFSKWGRVDVLVNNAGIGGFGLNNPRKIVDVNLVGVLYAICEILPLFRRCHATVGTGTIINIGSVGGVFPMPTTPVYGATKAGIIHLTKSLVKHCEMSHARIHALCPGYVDTYLGQEAMRDPGIKKAVMLQGGLMKPHFVARSLLRLCSEPTTGEIIVVLPARPYLKVPKRYVERHYLRLLSKLQPIAPTLGWEQ